MGLSYNKFVGDGTTRTFSMSFGYLKPEHVYVHVDGVSTAYTWDNETTLRLDVAPSMGADVTLSRSTPYAEKSADFADDSILDEVTLDAAMDEIFYIAQEVREHSIVKDLVTNTVNSEGLRVTNVGTPQDATDAVTKSYVDAADAIGLSLIASNQANAEQAESSAEEAAISATQAQIAANTATTKAAEAQQLVLTAVAGFTGFADGLQYDLGSVTDAATYFNHDFGSI